VVFVAVGSTPTFFSLPCGPCFLRIHGITNGISRRWISEQERIVDKKRFADTLSAVAAKHRVRERERDFDKVFVHVYAAFTRCDVY
jgi:hypothetical protein